MGQGHADSLGRMCAHACEHTHTHKFSVLGFSLTLTEHDSLPTPWLWTGPVSAALSGPGWSWILPGWFPRATPAAAELWILRGLRSGRKGAASSWGPEGFPGGQGSTETAAERAWGLHLPLSLQRNEAVLSSVERGELGFQV